MDNAEETQEWEILVPVADNEGKPFPLPRHQAWDEKVRHISGGLTIHKKAKGQWLSEGQYLYEEKMIPVRIACSEDSIEKIMDLTAEHYGQKAIKAALVSPRSIIKHYS